MAQVSLSISGNPVFLVLLILLLAAAALLFYRFTVPPLPKGRRLGLSFLRALGLTLLITVLFEPFLRVVRNESQPPAVAVLIDDSQSMAIIDGIGNRAEAVRRFLRDQPLGNLTSGAVVRYRPFSVTLGQATENEPDSIRFAGQATDLSATLRALKQQVVSDNIRAVIMVTDGNYTQGKNPIYEAETFRIPIFTVGIGDTTEQKDVLVEKITTNAVAYAGVQLPVDITVKSSGYGGQNVEVVLSEGGTVLDRRMVRLLGGTREYPVRLFAEPNEEGVKRFRASVSTLDGELTERNNTRSFFVKVLKSKLRILLLAGSPSPDVSAVRQALAEDERFRVESVVQKNPGEYYERQPGKESFDSCDCVILVGFPSSAASLQVVRDIQDLCERRRVPLLFIHGKQIDYSKLQFLAPWLPFDWSAGGLGELLVSPSISDQYRSHPLVRLEEGASEQSWQDLPPIYRTQTTFRAKPGAQVLAAMRVQNTVLEEPLVVVRTLNRHKVLAITGHGVWRWRLLAQGNQQTERFLPVFLSNAVRWLTTEEEEKRVRIQPVKETFTTAEAAEFAGQVYDEQLRPVDNADVRIELARGSEKFQLALSAVGNGRYQGSVNGLTEGDYTYRGTASEGSTAYGEDRGRFSVGQMNVEFIETKMNKQLLEQLAYQTGGTYHDVSHASGLARDVATGARLEPKERIHAMEVEVWNWRYIAGLLVLLFATEWFVRKRNGML